MELRDILKVANYDVSIYAIYNDDEPSEPNYKNDKVVFTWDINGGAWGSVGSHKYFETPNDAWDNLKEYIKIFEGFC